MLVAGRVKPHTDFVGDIESGLMKMMLIGLGKHDGAKIYHRAIQNYSFGQIVRSVAVAGAGELPHRRRPGDRRKRLRSDGQDRGRPARRVRSAREGAARSGHDNGCRGCRFASSTSCFIDEIGKNISGAGMDTNVVGRKFQMHAAAPDEYPKVKRIVVRGLSEETRRQCLGHRHGRILHDPHDAAKTNLEFTRINCLTSGHVAAAMMPVDFETDREILDEALPTIGLTEPPDAKILWIRNTLDVAEVECSQTIPERARAAATIWKSSATCASRPSTHKGICRGRYTIWRKWPDAGRLVCSE